MDVIFLGLKENGTNSFAVWPSPTQDVLRIQLPQGHSGTLMINVLSSDGKLVHQERSSTGPSLLTLSLAGIAPGTYMLQVMSGSDVWSSRFVKVP